MSRRFPGSTFVEVANSVHVTALLDWDLCASGGAASANVEVRGPDGSEGALRIGWLKRPQATATVDGVVDGRQLRATMPAP